MRKKVKSDNRKALPKFFITILASAVAGALTAFLLLNLKGTDAAAAFVAKAQHTLLYSAPYSIWCHTLVLGAAALVLYRRAAALFAGWDGEEEAVVEQADRTLDRVLLLSNIMMLLSFFLLGCVQLSEIGPALRLLTITGFLVSMAVIVLLQQKAVDLTRKMNPEKKGSIYDTNFRKIWLDSCDENEQRQIGQAAYKSFCTVNTACVVLWLVLLVADLLVPVGILPLALVSVIWAISILSFSVEAGRLNRRR